MLLKPLCSVAEVDLERRNRSKRRDRQVDPGSLDRCERKRPRGRPRKIKEFREKRPVGRPRKWTPENIADRPKYKPKDPDDYKKYYHKVIKPRLKAKKAEELEKHTTLTMLMEQLYTIITKLSSKINSSTLT